MKILLITPSDQKPGFEYVFSGRENLGVEYLLAAARKAGYDVDSINQNFTGEHAIDDVNLNNYDVIGFSLPFWEYRKQYVDLINKLAFQTKAFFIAGGHAATIGAEYFLHMCSKLEGIVMGEGEETLVDLLDNLPESRQVPGFYTRTGFIKRKLSDIDRVSFPARDELRWFLGSSPPFKEAYIASTRGCHNNCSFCSIPTYYHIAHGPTWRERSVSNVCTEINELLDSWPQLDSLSFTDDNFIGFEQERLERGIQIAKHIHVKRPELTFEITSRADSIDYDTFTQLAEYGLYGVYLGIEAGVQRVLDSFNKRTTVEQNLKSIEILSKIGVGCDVGFIMFSPNIILDEVRQNLLFLQHILNNYRIFVHPAATFRCLRTYPKDLGKAAIEEKDHDIVSYNKSVNTLRIALEKVWESKYEAEFLRSERLAAGDKSVNLSYIKNSRHISLDMIEIGLQLIKEIEKHPTVNTQLLVNNFINP